MRRGESAIDLVRQELADIQRRDLSQVDQQRLEDWLALLRETELHPLLSCDLDSASSLGVTDASIEEASARDTVTAFTLGADAMFKLMALTMMCDANRSLVLHWPGFVTFDWDGMHHDYDHDALSHRNGSAAAGGTCVSGVLEDLRQIDEWYAGRYSQLVSLIDSISEGDGTMLDNSAVAWIPEVSDGLVRNNNNLPIVIAGSAGGYLKQGVSLNLEGGILGTGNSEASCADGNYEIAFNTGSTTGQVPLNKLYVTLLNALGAENDGAPISEFGVCDSNDVEAGITDPGEFDALKA